MTLEHRYDVVIVGSGAAGIALALTLGDACSVAILSKGEITDGSTVRAQGGIAAAMDDDDSVESHIRDTMVAGDGLCDAAAVHFVATNASAAIHWLVAQGVKFNGVAGKFHLTREGGHSKRRILHAEDATGLVLANALSTKLHASGATIFTNYVALNLVKQRDRCVGLYALNTKNNCVETFHGKFVVLATGGASKVYLYSTNPDCASGDGIAMAATLGAKIANMEFNQFHPTCLYHPRDRSFLISEAVRGEGGILLLPNGDRFMHRFDERLELAPRDIVARAIDFEMKRLGIECVYLNISHRSAKFVRKHFPNIYRRCFDLGLDITKESIPVVPAAHYTCGGVAVDHHGRTTIDGLYAIGEVACSGLHGANRMASNSLLECLVYGRSAGADILTKLAMVSQATTIPAWSEQRVISANGAAAIQRSWLEIRTLMWNYVGIVRSNARLAMAWERLLLLKSEIRECYDKFEVEKNLIELRNLVAVAELMVTAATVRKENRGLHYNIDNLTAP